MEKYGLFLENVIIFFIIKMSENGMRHVNLKYIDKSGIKTLFSKGVPCSKADTGIYDFYIGGKCRVYPSGRIGIIMKETLSHDVDVQFDNGNIETVNLLNLFYESLFGS